MLDWLREENKRLEVYVKNLESCLRDEDVSETEEYKEIQAECEEWEREWDELFVQHGQSKEEIDTLKAECETLRGQRGRDLEEYQALAMKYKAQGDLLTLRSKEVQRLEGLKYDGNAWRTSNELLLGEVELLNAKYTKEVEALEAAYERNVEELREEEKRSDGLEAKVRMYESRDDQVEILKEMEDGMHDKWTSEMNELYRGQAAASKAIMEAQKKQRETWNMEGKSRSETEKLWHEANLRDVKTAFFKRMEDKRKEKQGEIDQLRKEMDELKESHKTEIARARLGLSTGFVGWT